MRDFKAKTREVNGGRWTVFLGLCKGCGLCLARCPNKALSFGKELGVYSTPAPEIVIQKCTLCGLCEIVCPDCAIKIEKKKKNHV